MRAAADVSALKTKRGLPARRKAARQNSQIRSPSTGHRCGLCGKARNLVRTECCGQWICDDEGNYALFSYARNSCSRNHRRYTLCGSHRAEGHAGAWQECSKCRNEFETELYVYYGTNEYNFTKLENPPVYEPTECSGCGSVIRLGEGGYSVQGRRYWCGRCSSEKLR